MTLQDFHYLSFIERLNVVKEFGELADNYISKTENIRCFSVHKFFVEVVYNTEMTHIIDIRGFETGMTLDKYVINFNGGNNRKK